jgi:hypothetical protein
VAEKKNVVVDAFAPPDPILLTVSVILTVPPALAAPPEATNDETVKSGVGDWSVIGTAEGTDTFPQASANCTPTVFGPSPAGNIQLFDLLKASHGDQVELLLNRIHAQALPALLHERVSVTALAFA